MQLLIKVTTQQVPKKLVTRIEPQTFEWIKLNGETNWISFLGKPTRWCLAKVHDSQWNLQTSIFSNKGTTLLTKRLGVSYMVIQKKDLVQTSFMG